jgi:hypothetical protein
MMQKANFYHYQGEKEDFEKWLEGWKISSFIV